MSEEVDALRSHLQMLEETLMEQETTLRQRYESELSSLRRRNTDLEASVEEVLTLRLAIVEKDASHAQLRRNLSHAIDSLERRLSDGERAAEEERTKLLAELEKERASKSMLLKEVEALHRELMGGYQHQHQPEDDIHSVREALKTLAQRYKALKEREVKSPPSRDHYLDDRALKGREARSSPPRCGVTPPSPVRQPVQNYLDELKGREAKGRPPVRRDQSERERHQEEQEVHPFAQHYLDALALQEKKVRAVLKKGPTPQVLKKQPVKR